MPNLCPDCGAPLIHGACIYDTPESIATLRLDMAAVKGHNAALEQEIVDLKRAIMVASTPVAARVPENLVVEASLYGPQILLSFLLGALFGAWLSRNL